MCINYLKLLFSILLVFFRFITIYMQNKLHVVIIKDSYVNATYPLFAQEFKQTLLLIYVLQKLITL